MKKLSLKLLFVTLITIMLLTFLSVQAGAASKKDLVFELRDDGCSYAVDLCDDMATGKLVIPSEYKGLPVIEIGSFAFSESDRLTNIVIPTTVMYIGEFAFSDCNSLEKINIPESVVYIGEYAFLNCNNLTSIKIPKGVTYISACMFDDCENLETVELPDGLTTIGVDAFASCSSLNNIVIPDTVTKIETQAFMFCDSLESINIPDKVKSISEEAFYGCSNLKKIIIGKNVNKIGKWAFYDCGKLEDVYLFSKDLSRIPDGNRNFIDAEWHYVITKTTKATISKNGKKTIICEDCGKIESETVIFRLDKITLSKKKYTYNGKEKIPDVTVKDSKGNTLKKGTDYTVTYPKKRKSIGKYTVTVTFKGNYSGKKKLSFEIVPAKVTLSKLTAGKKQLVAMWKTVSNVTGYEVIYSTSKDFRKKTTKTITVENSKTKKTTIKKLKKGKKYYVKVRAYKIVSGNKLYGAYSSVKNVKVK